MADIGLRFDVVSAEETTLIGRISDVRSGRGSDIVACKE